MAVSRSIARPGLAHRLTVVSAALSVLLFGGLATVSYLYGSKLALAQAADSLSDVFTAVVLLWAIKLSSEEPDEDHPFGHHGAQPIAALIVAVLAGVLAFEVLRAAVVGLVSGEHATMHASLAVTFGIKVCAKAIVAAIAQLGGRRVPSPAMRALSVDARNDVAVGLLALGGYFAARYGDASVDAWLAIPVAVWVGAAGVVLALENIRLLMGEAPSGERLGELRDIAASVSGVERVCGLKSRFYGTSISVRAAVVVDPLLTVKAAHDIGERVELALLAEPDVSDAAVHIDVD